MAGQYLVLANSRKLGGHCVAVVNPDGRWVRPVSDAEHGELTTAQCWLAGNTRMLRPLDVVEAEFGRRLASPYQPEDHEAPTTWQLWRPQPSPAQISEWLAATVNHGADFLSYARQDRIPESDITTSSPLEASLALVRPNDPAWVVQTTMSGGKQVRVSFTLGGVTDDRGRRVQFDLVVTDPAWEDRVMRAAGSEGRSVTSEELDLREDNLVYFTVSLGEAFNGYHYKLVAAVVT